MKNHILLFLIATLFYSFTSLSQSNSYFSDGESWASELNSKYSWRSNYVQQQGDTIIGNDTLVKLAFIEGPDDTIFYLAKNDTGVLITYHSRENYTNSLNYRIIDYSRTDSITAKWYDSSNNYWEYFAYPISTIDTMYFNGKPVRIYKLDDFCSYDGDFVVEGVFGGEFDPIYFYCFEIRYRMTCYSSNGIVYRVGGIGDGKQVDYSFTQNGNGECFLENVGLPKEETTRFEFYPNPVSEVLTIESQRATEIKIVNIYGQIVYTVDIPKGTKDIDVTGLESGVYLIRSSAGESRRFIKS
tara:strand:+ start:2312 stop:3208 length:897 start_codon:yes stop_codon:yes gene_type:complete